MALSMTGGVLSIIDKFRPSSTFIISRPQFIAADSHDETQRICESSHESFSVVNKLLWSQLGKQAATIAAW